LVDSARIFDAPATANFLNLHPLEASLEFVEEAGVKTVREHTRRLLDRLAEGLVERGYNLSAAANPESNSAILAFRAGSSQATSRVFETLESSHIRVSLRHDWIRVSPYLYNAEEDIDALLEACRGITPFQALGP